MTYTYDSWGNLTAKSVYAYTTATDPGTPISTIPYGYTNTAWGDQLTSYDGQTISYDAMGNPTTYRGKALTWRGKQLMGIADGTDTIAYSYDENGLRLQKTVNNVATDYYYNGKVLIGLVKGNDTLRFSYDAAGLAQAVNHNGTYYYYLRNGQGDIVKLIDSSGATVVEYTYNSWGKLLSCTGTLATTLGALNPFRYRGYVYDEETGFYYLKSRYYDPETCRFISADVYLSTGQGVLGHNCYAYCRNNPISPRDVSGRLDFEDDDDNPLNDHCDDYGPIGGNSGNVNGSIYHSTQHYVAPQSNYSFFSTNRVNQPGSYEIFTQEGNVYVGKGPMQRMNESICRIESNGYHVILDQCIWEAAPNDEIAFINEYMRMAKYEFDFGGKLINKIMSPGMKLFHLWFN